jgi:spermidine synthase
MTSHPFFIYGITFILAFCSLFYEFAFAQVLAVSIGGTKIQYLIVISLFTFSLGMGSLFYGKIKSRAETRKILLWVEIGLTFLGLLGPFALTWILRPGVFPTGSDLPLTIAYLTVALVGLLSGFEIPCMFDLSPSRNGRILAADYAGMLAASIAFPLFFLPVFGTASSVMIVALLNCTVFLWLRSVEGRNWETVIGLFAIVSSMILTIVFRTELNELLSYLYLGADL